MSARVSKSVFVIKYKYDATRIVISSRIWMECKRCEETAEKDWRDWWHCSKRRLWTAYVCTHRQEHWASINDFLSRRSARVSFYRLFCKTETFPKQILASVTMSKAGKTSELFNRIQRQMRIIILINYWRNDFWNEQAGKT